MSTQAVLEAPAVSEAPPIPVREAEFEDPVLEARSLVKRYGELEAVAGLDLSIQPGEVYCLLGPNGAGKTTTIHLFLGFIEPSSGRVRVSGFDVAKSALEARKRLAYVPEQVMLYRNLSGLENLQYFAALGGRETLSAERLTGILVDVGLPRPAVGRRVAEYSKGMRQKVGIAIAVAKHAEALLLDEPTSGLDPKASREFSELIETLRGRGVAVLMATHDLFRAKESGTRIGIMRHGRLVTELSTDEIGHADLERIYLDHMHE
jgi:ABC-2 type transport system ATP-binding protein